MKVLLASTTPPHTLVVELAVVMGACKHVNRAKAMQHVLGYALAIDVTARNF